jgi:hypothetical protein
MVASGDWDPAAASAPGSSTASGSWDPDPSVALGSSVGPESWEPDPSVEELSSSCRLCGSDRSVTSTILTASEVAAM